MSFVSMKCYNISFFLCCDPMLLNTHFMSSVVIFNQIIALVKTVNSVGEIG